MGPLKAPPAINATIKNLLEGGACDDGNLGVEEVGEDLTSQ